MPIIREDLTITRFGYNSINLPPNSGKSVMLECELCGVEYEKEFRGARQKHRCSIIRQCGSVVQKRCYRCKEWRELSYFTPVRNEAGGVAKLCKMCRKEHPAIRAGVLRQRKRIRESLQSGDPTRYLRYRVKQVTTRANTKGIRCDVDRIFMIDLWYKQNGRCYYTGIPMLGVPKGGRFVWDSPSIDRLVPVDGYVKGNVVWCLMSVNAFKGDLTETAFREVINNARWWTEKGSDPISTEDGFNPALLTTE